MSTLSATLAADLGSDPTTGLVFPLTFRNIGIDVRRTLETSTDVYTSRSGLELRLAAWSFPHYRYRIQCWLRSDASYLEYQTLAAFFSMTHGPWGTFLFSDPVDNQATDMPFGVGDGVATDFQLQRTLLPAALRPAASATNFWPRIGHGYEPILDIGSDVTVAVNGSVVPTAVIAPVQSGVVTFAAPPYSGTALTWSGSYFRRVRFASDTLETDQDVVGMWEVKTLELMSAVQ